MPRWPATTYTYDLLGASFDEHVRRIALLLVIILLIVAPTALLLGSLETPFVPALEPMYYLFHRAHSPAWYLRNPVTRRMLIQHCFTPTLACVNALAAGIEAHDPQVTTLRFRASEQWQDPTR